MKHCLTGEMVADILTKPLHGEQFPKLRARIMNCPIDLEPANMPLTPRGDDAQECLEEPGRTRTKEVTWADRVRRGPRARS